MPSSHSFPFQPQYDAADCGPACLQMVAAWHGLDRPLHTWRSLCNPDGEGCSLHDLEIAARHVGLDTVVAALPFDQTAHTLGLRQAPLPCIAHWDENHFVVVVQIDRRRVCIADPALGMRRVSIEEFRKHWEGSDGMGRVLLLEPGARFQAGSISRRTNGVWSVFADLLRQHRGLMGQVLLGIFTAGLVQFALPFLTQAVVDVGIQQRDIHFIWLVLAGQLALFAGQVLVRFLQDRILLFTGTSMHIQLLADFLRKMFRRPIRQLEIYQTGDLLQRSTDQQRVGAFLTTGVPGLLHATFTFVVFSLVLLIYSPVIFGVFLLSSLLYSGWLLLFLPKRAMADQQRFSAAADHQHHLLEMFEGQRDIRLFRSEEKHLDRWAHIQQRHYEASLRALHIAQWQEAGALAVSALKDLFITGFAAVAVVEGRLSFGMLLAIMFIIGQLSQPLQQLITFVRSAQDARLSLQRLQDMAGEAPTQQATDESPPSLPRGSLSAEHIRFRYAPTTAHLFEDLSLTLPRGITSAIAGASGCGKTTLLKLFLGLYQPEAGRILIDGTDLLTLPPQTRWPACTALFPDSYVFSDSIAANIAGPDLQPDPDRVRWAARIALFDAFVESLPHKWNTRIGQKGRSLSDGQRQRLLIARAVYQQPSWLFLDEATNALDASSEAAILQHIKSELPECTVVLVAHRASTLRHADTIHLLHEGRIAESGSFDELMAKGGRFYQLMKAQSG